MARSMRVALLLLPVLMLTTACRLVEQQKDLAARIAAFCVLRPILAMQSSQATLTQATFRETDAVAPKQTAPRSEVARVASVVSPARAAEPAVRIADVEISQHVMKAMKAVPPMTSPFQVVQVQLQHESHLRTVAVAAARDAVVQAKCEIQVQREKLRQQQARRKVVVLAPNVFEIPASAIVVGQGS